MLYLSRALVKSYTNKEITVMKVHSKMYSKWGIYNLIKKHGGKMELDAIYKDIERSGELSEYDRKDNDQGEIRYKHNTRGFLQQLKDIDRVLVNPSRGVWKTIEG